MPEGMIGLTGRSIRQTSELISGDLFSHTHTHARTHAHAHTHTHTHTNTHKEAGRKEVDTLL